MTILQKLKLLTIVLLSVHTANAGVFNFNSSMVGSSGGSLNSILQSSQRDSAKGIESSGSTEQEKEGSRYKNPLDMGFEERTRGFNSTEIYIQNNISKFIGEIEQYKTYNLRKNNFLKLYKDDQTVQIIKGGVIQGLESSFGIGGMGTVFDNLKEERVNECRNLQISKRLECENKADKSVCLAELAEIESNCYKVTQNSNTGLKGLAQAIGEIQDNLLNSISQSLPNLSQGNSSGPIKSLTPTVGTSGPSTSPTSLPVMSTPPTKPQSAQKNNFGFAMPNISNVVNNSIGGLITGITVQEECNVMECLYYPRRAKYKYDSSGNIETQQITLESGDSLTVPKYSSEFDSKCVKDKKEPKIQLAEKVHEFKSEVKIKATKEIIKHMFKELPANMIKKQNERAVACAFEAMQNTITATDDFLGDYGDEADGSSGLNEGQVEDAKKQIEDDLKNAQDDQSTKKSVVASEFSQLSKTVGECISLANSQTKEKTTIKGGINLHKGSPEVIYESMVVTITSQMPFVSALGAQVKAEMQELFTQGWKSSELIKQCIAKGQTDTFILNYNRCVQKDEDMDNTFEFNFKTPQLLDALRRQTKSECVANLKSSGSSLKWVFNEVNTSFKTSEATKDAKTKPAVGSEEYLTRWFELEGKLKTSTQILEKLKIPYKGYLQTKNATCAEKFYNILAENTKLEDTNIDSCSILDEKEDTKNGKSTKLDNSIKINIFDDNPENGIPKDLYTSVQMLCIDSATDIITELENNEIPSKEVLETYYAKESEFNPLNARHKDGKKGKYSEFKLTRSISNVAFCNRFWKSVGKLGGNQGEYDRLVSLKIAEEILRSKTELGGDIKNLYKQKDNFLEGYKNTVEGLSKLTKSEKHAFCVNRNKQKTGEDTLARQGRLAATDFCRDYKVMLFDKLLRDAKKDLDHPIITTEQRKLMRETMRQRRLEMKTGVVQMIGGE